MKEARLPVSEIFGPTLQGEGAYAGRRAVFIRFGGCDSHCEWCDTAYAKNTSECCELTVDEILYQVEEMRANCNLVILTGGNPCLQDLGHLCARLRIKGWGIHVETQGTIIPYWLDRVDLITICPKIRSNIAPIVENINAAQKMAPIQLKYVVFTENDYETARELARLYRYTKFIIQPGWDPKTNDYPYGLRALAERVAKDSLLPDAVIFMPQLHRILWGGVKGV
jgi:7-carboxy-7-deazaguanine synthase